MFNECLFNELSCRFFLNLPSEELSDTRIMVQVHQSYWFLIDNWCDFQIKYSLDVLPWNLTQFIYLYKIWFIKKLKLNSLTFDTIWSNYIDIYYKEIPVAGVVLFRYQSNIKEIEVLMIKGATSQKWGFPKGKINKNELWLECAARELLEETNWNGLLIGLQTNKIEEIEIQVEFEEKKNFKLKHYYHSKIINPKPFKKHLLQVFFLNLHKLGNTWNKQYIEYQNKSIFVQTPFRLYFFDYILFLKQLQVLTRHDNKTSNNNNNNNNNINNKFDLNEFKINDKKEVSEIQWHPLKNLLLLENLLYLFRKNYHLIKDSIFCLSKSCT